ncbi:MAG: dihydropteroate synthase [Dehalococcoidia bacterium]
MAITTDDRTPDDEHGALIPTFRVAPAGPAHLASDPEAPCTAWFEGDRQRLQVATSAVGLGIDLRDEVSRIVASRRELGLLRDALRVLRSPLVEPLTQFLEPVQGWKLRTQTLATDRPVIMGILNLTEDSFSGDGVGADTDSAVRRAVALREAGADIIDVGAESARADRPVLEEGAEAELVGATMKALVREGLVVSSDTYKAGVAEAALSEGAELINDISGLTLGMGAAGPAAEAGAGYVLNFSYSVPKQRPPSPPEYDDVMEYTLAWMELRLGQIRAAGLARENIAIDPGIAFGKSHDEDIQVLRRIGELQTFGHPVLLAHSRKNFIGSVNGNAPAERDPETHVASALAYAQGVRIFRVHDPEGARRALSMAAAIVDGAAGAFAPDAESWPWRAGASAAHMTNAAPDKSAPAGQRW